MNSARAPHARLIVPSLILALIMLAAAPVVAQQRLVASASPLEMTRDAGGAGAPASGVHVGDAGPLNPAGQIARMTGALAVVLLLILGGAHVIRRSPLMAQAPGTIGAPSDLSFPGTLKAAFSFLSPLAALQPLKRAAAQARVPLRPTAASAAVPPLTETGLMRLCGTQALPGSAASVYLVQIGTKGFLLGASANGPIQLLSEIPCLEAVASLPVAEAVRDQDEDEAFEAMLREQLAPIPEREDTRVAQSVVERLTRTRERLSQRLGDETTPSQDRVRV